METKIAKMKADYSLDDLRLFRLVASLGSYTKAAELSGIPLSTLSRRIAALESALTIRLLERNAHRLILTRAGTEFLQRCAPMLDELQQVTEHLHDSHHEASGEIRFAAPINLTQSWLGQLLNDFMQLHPQIRIDLTLSNNNSDLAGNQMDMAVRVGELQSAEWIARPLAEIRFHLCCASHRPQWQRIAHPAELLSLPTVVAKPSTIWRLTEQGSNEHYELLAAPQARLLVDDLACARDAVASGLGIGLLPLSLLAKHRQGGRIVAVESRWQGRPKPIHLLYRERSNLPRRIQLLRDYLLEHAPQAANHYCQPSNDQ